MVLNSKHSLQISWVCKTTKKMLNKNHQFIMGFTCVFVILITLSIILNVKMRPCAIQKILVLQKFRSLFFDFVAQQFCLVVIGLMIKDHLIGLL